MVEKKSILPGLLFACLISFLVGIIVASQLDLPPLSKAEETIAPDLESSSPLATSQSVLKPSMILPGGESPFVSIAQEAIPTVVSIRIEGSVRGGRDFRFEGPWDELFKDFFKFREEEMPERRIMSAGTGIIIDPAGYILTNNHVVDGANKISIVLHDETIFKSKQVKVVGTDPRTDLAILKVDSDVKMKAIRMGNSDEIRVGDWAIAVGNPFGYEGTVTVGVISAKGRSGINLGGGPINMMHQNFIQTDAAINRGNSGGPLLNIQGEMIGINTAISTETGLSAGVGFAIPINMAKFVYPQLIEKGSVERGWLGVSIRDPDPDLKESLGVKDGVLVAGVNKESPAEKGGMEPGDVIIEFDGTPISTTTQLQTVVAKTQTDKKVKVTIIRDKKKKSLSIKLGEMPKEITQGNIPPIEDEESPWLGIGVSEDEEGVIVERIDPGSPADEAGLRRGDVIKKIGEKAIDDLSDYQKAENNFKKETKPVLFWVNRNDQYIFIPIRPNEEEG
jgi:serine protease Do